MTLLTFLFVTSVWADSDTLQYLHDIVHIIMKRRYYNNIILAENFGKH